MFATRRSLLRTLERERIAHAAERAQLIDTICRLAGKPPQPDGWQPQPVPDDPDRGRFVADPDQMP